MDSITLFRVFGLAGLVGVSTCGAQPAAAPEPDRVSMIAALAEPIDWVEVSGRCFTMGQDQTYPEEAPAHETCVETLWISRFEVTNAQFADFVLATGYQTLAERGADGLPAGSFVFEPGPATLIPGSWWQFRETAAWSRPNGQPLEPVHARQPVIHVAYEDAVAFAAHHNARLPREDEWEMAARGTLDGEVFAWAPSDELPDTRRANTWQGLFPVINQSEDGYYGIAPVGQYKPNTLGLHDMIGNVWELTATPYLPSHERAQFAEAENTGFDPAQPGRPVQVIKGGSYLCAPNFCYRFRPAARQAQDQGLSTSHIGFRLARSTDPARD